MKSILAVYDDTVVPGALIRDTVGDRSFGEVLVRRETIGDGMRAFLAEALPGTEIRTLTRAPGAAEALLSELRERALLGGGNVPIVHLYADFVVRDTAGAAALIKKCAFAEKEYLLRQGGRAVLRVFPDAVAYAAFLEAAIVRGSTETDGMAEDCGEIKNCSGAFACIADTDGFVNHICGQYDVRYFNSVTGDAYTLIKRSTDKQKIKSEYTLWRLLPDEMKQWFVMPYDYKETDEGASYRMERLHVPNLAVKYVHGAMGADEFEELMELYFHFLTTRVSKREENSAHIARMRRLYIEKVIERMDKLKAAPQYARLSALLAAGTPFESVDVLTARYTALFDRLVPRAKLPSVAVIGHGDPGFANALFYRPTRMLRFVDPKGALTEDDLWADPYYDLAKLSHSVCGRYDFFNSGRYDISLNRDLSLKLTIPFDNAAFIRSFRARCEAAGFDFAIVRLCEASLFLSMLPLHIDDEHKVLGFALNAAQILSEVEAYV